MDSNWFIREDSRFEYLYNINSRPGRQSALSYPLTTSGANLGILTSWTKALFCATHNSTHHPTHHAHHHYRHEHIHHAIEVKTLVCIGI